MKITPLFDRILVEPNITVKEQTTGSLILPESAQDKPLLGKIVAVGNGKMANNDNIIMQIAVGDLILYNKYSGSEFKNNGKSLVIMRQSEILAKVENENG